MKSLYPKRELTNMVFSSVDIRDFEEYPSDPWLEDGPLLIYPHPGLILRLGAADLALGGTPGFLKGYLTWLGCATLLESEWSEIIGEKEEFRTLFYENLWEPRFWEYMTRTEGQTPSVGPRRWRRYEGEGVWVISIGALSDYLSLVDPEEIREDIEQWLIHAGSPGVPPMYHRETPSSKCEICVQPGTLSSVRISSHSLTRIIGELGKKRGYEVKPQKKRRIQLD